MSRTVLAVCAHPDDEVLGVGGTLRRHVQAGDDVHVLFMTDGTPPGEAREERVQAAEAATRALGVATTQFGGLEDTRLSTTSTVERNAPVEEAVADLRPDLVYTHTSRDINADHVATHRAVTVAVRPPTSVTQVLAFEVPSGTEWQSGEHEPFAPNYYVDVSESLDMKVEALKMYETELREPPHPRSDTAVRARAVTRGSESGFAAAEAFSLVAAYRRDP